ncbi:MAG: hypothetical protein WCD86_18770 [Ktedonobacteraceae bacterium]
MHDHSNDAVYDHSHEHDEEGQSSSSHTHGTLDADLYGNRAGLRAV